MPGFFFLLLTVAEVITLVATVTLLGFGLTLLLAIVAMIAGIALLRWQGLMTLEKLMTRLEFGQAPLQEGWDGLCLMAAGLLLIIPGLFTDLLALLLLIPWVRQGLFIMISRSGKMKGSYWFDQQALAPSRAQVIEATYEEVVIDPAPPRTP